LKQLYASANEVILFLGRERPHQILLPPGCTVEKLRIEDVYRVKMQLSVMTPTLYVVQKPPYRVQSEHV
jgi:hypothetical protein